MPLLNRMIRSTSVHSLQEFFNSRSVDLPPAVNWAAPEKDVIQSLLQAVDKMDDMALARVVKDAERVTSMVDEAGQTALYSVIEDRANLDNLGNAYDRVQWMFRHDPTGFLRAEEVRFTDERRRGRMWDGFIGTPNVALQRDTVAVAAFGKAVRERFASNNVHRPVSQ